MCEISDISRDIFDGKTKTSVHQVTVCETSDIAQENADFETPTFCNLDWNNNKLNIIGEY